MATDQETREAHDREVIESQLGNAGFGPTAEGQWREPMGLVADPPEYERPLMEGYDAHQSSAVKDLLDTVNARGSQYGTPTDDKANLRGALLFDIDPIMGALLRANDKFVRLQNLTRDRTGGGAIIIQGSKHAAQIRDQMLDIAGYMIKAMEMLDERVAE